MASLGDRDGQDKRDGKGETDCQAKSAFLAGKETEVSLESMELLGRWESKARPEKLAEKVRLEILANLEATNKANKDMEA